MIGMDSAINKKTGKIVQIESLWLEKDSSYLNPEDDEWLADPQNIENWEEIKERFPEGIGVVFCKSKSFVNFKGTSVFIRPHFRILNKSRLGININPESIEHKIAKNWLYNRIKNNDLELVVSTIKKPFKYENKSKILDFDVDFNKIGVEISQSSSPLKRRIADIIIPFKSNDNFFGRGIVIEIQFSNQRDKTTDDRTQDWVYRGYSICWIWKDDFNWVDNKKIIFELKKNEIHLHPYIAELKFQSKQHIKNLYFTSKEVSRALDEKQKNMVLFFQNKNDELKYLTSLYNEKISKTDNLLIQDLNQLKQSFFNSIRDDLYLKLSDMKDELTEKMDLIYKEKIWDIREEFGKIKCPNCKNDMVLKNGKFGVFLGCSNYPECNKIMFERN